MKKPQALCIALLGTIIIAITSGGCGRSPKFVVGNPNRMVTISPASPGTCEVDYPVVLLKKSKNHTIAWAAETNDFWILFDSTTGSPIDPTNKPILVSYSSNTGTGKLSISSSASSKYYMYAIYDKDPSANPQPPPCKAANDDHDTGLNVKN